MVFECSGHLVRHSGGRGDYDAYHPDYIRDGQLAYSGAALAANPPKPRISMASAKALALKLAPGVVRSSEYEKEGGAWRYSFDIQQKGHIQEIGIDAMTGRVVENVNEGKVDRD